MRLPILSSQVNEVEEVLKGRNACYCLAVFLPFRKSVNIELQFDH